MENHVVLLILTNLACENHKRRDDPSTFKYNYLSMLFQDAFLLYIHTQSNLSLQTPL